MPGFIDQFIQKVKDAMSGGSQGSDPGRETQHGAPMAPDPSDSHVSGSDRPDASGQGPYRTPGTRPYYPDDPADGGAPGSTSLPGGADGQEGNTGTGMTDDALGAAELLGGGTAGAIVTALVGGGVVTTLGEITIFGEAVAEGAGMVAEGAGMVVGSGDGSDDSKVGGGDDKGSGDGDNGGDGEGGGEEEDSGDDGDGVGGGNSRMDRLSRQIAQGLLLDGGIIGPDDGGDGDGVGNRDLDRIANLVGASLAAGGVVPPGDDGEMGDDWGQRRLDHVAALVAAALTRGGYVPAPDDAGDGLGDGRPIPTIGGPG